MNRQEIMQTMEQLAHTQGYYARRLQDLREEKVDNPEEYENDMRILESQNFKDTADLVRFFEE